MKRVYRIAKLLFAASIYTFVSLQSVYADDTEIFFAPPSAATQENPNILFVIDTSGSMKWGVDGTYSVPYEDRRMTIVQDVMDTVLTEITNVNAGLMRFNNGKSGPVLFPVLDIDLPATPTAFDEVTDGNDDVFQNSDSTMDTTNTELKFEYSSAAAVSKTAIRFDSINIPQGAVIESASIVFTAKSDSAATIANSTISGEYVDDSPAFTGSDYEIATRSATTTTATVLWNQEQWFADQIYATDDISSVVQEITSRTGWCGGNALTLFFEQAPLTSRIAYSNEGVAAEASVSQTIFAPRLKVTYKQTFPAGANKCMTNEVVSQINNQNHDWEVESDGNVNNPSSPDLAFYFEGSDPQQGVGLVFENVNVPQGATITSADIEFTSKNSTTGAVSTVIKTIQADDIPNTSDYNTLKNQTPRSSGTSWTTASVWNANEKYFTPDISSEISSVTNRVGWSAGNAMAFFLEGSSGYHEADSYSSPADAPKLRIRYRGTFEIGTITMRDDLKAAVASLTPSGGTPIAGTMAEAGRYFRGDGVFYGATRNNNQYSRVSHELSFSSTGTIVRDSGCDDSNLDDYDCRTEKIAGSPNYVSPIVESCQTSHIVLLTDGYLNSHVSSTQAIYSEWTGYTGSCSGGTDCAKKIAGWLHTNDVSPAVTGKQTVTTHTIGFGSGADPILMSEMATAGGGGYYNPQTKDALVDAITNIVDSIASINTTFVTSGVTVNQYNRISHNKERYFSLFTPENKETWPGNIKKYELNGPNLTDVSGANAVDALTGEFKDAAQSFWSNLVDGNEIDKGGAAGELYLGRTAYTNVSGSNLTNGANALRQSNSSITSAMLGGITGQRRDTVLYWVEGYDVNDPNYDPTDSSSLSNTPTRQTMGDPLHSQPVIIEYNDASGAIADSRIYVGTNHGFLHSIDASDGREAWSFIPKKLLPRLDSVVADSNSSAHSYGLDGSPVVRIMDANKNGAVDPGEKAYLYIGQRRGGDSYFALDISNPDAPKFMFEINNASGFSRLGQTWSKPSIVNMNLPGVNSDKLVMVFGGGYDTAQDIEGTPFNTDSIGNDLYIADALTGAKLWSARDDALPHGGSAGPVSSLNSVPADVALFDLDDDGLTDNIYVTDTKAQVFRFDVDNTSQTIKGGRIAQLQISGDTLNNRRFYYPADTSFIREVGDSFIAVAIGSGYRAHPLNTQVNDYFYVIKDKGVLTGAYDMDISWMDMQDVTSLVDSDSNGVSDAVEILNDDTAGKKGWYLNLNSGSGEKVLSRSITFNNAVLFTTYIPPGSSATACEAAAGSGRVYALNIKNGNPYLDTNHDGDLNETDRYVDLVQPGIPPEITISQPEDLKPIACIGKECFEDFVPTPTPGLMGLKWRKN